MVPFEEVQGKVLFHVLGPLEVHNATVHRFGSSKPATVLAALLLQPNSWVTVDHLVETTWQEQAVPASAEANLKTYVWQLRRLLPEHDGRTRIESRSGAYRLRVGPGDLDADRAGELASEARRTATDDTAAALTLVQEALRLWRGRPFEGVEAAVCAAVVTRFEELHLRLREHLAELQLVLGHGQDAVATLRTVTADAPLREGAWAQLVRTLHAADMRAEALAACRRAGELLSTELGVEPGPVLAEAQRLVLGVARPARTRRELPRDIALVGRTAEVAAVRRAATELAPVVLVDGMAGVGKTALAVHAAHRLAPGYPDGHFFVNLRGADPRSAPAAPAVLGRLLRGIGTPAAEMPSDLDERSALWRSELARRRVLLVLDDVPDGDQLAPLLPAAPGCLTLVTTSNRGWHPDGAVRVGLEPLGDRAAAALLVAAVGGPLAVVDHAAVAAVVRHCGGLPAALRDAAARLRTRPHWTVRRLAEELDDDPCRVLSDALRRSISDASSQLDSPEVAAWHALGDLPSEFEATVAARALGMTTTAARPVLEKLVDRGLLAVSSPERYRSHVLLRHLAGCATSAGRPSRDDHREHRRVA
ncbi:DNA-binding SARP family transcriptional activator [Micromonospora pisi]|uniref:DNA-binding SARP family transcriptional activator n=1 Tax=Micromonospora pisi TaxID=589240 RepID=A0A495JSD0_9ACTN|nr:BTAD domain-containing putative transcriptional regulator [Micromonospora pisi]RKR91883.1 DNA-binding SARP family transcriptional activator [Micromonospora pisi]